MNAKLNDEFNLYSLCDKKTEFLDLVIQWNLNEWGQYWGENAAAVTRKQYEERLNTNKIPIAYVVTLKQDDKEIPVGTFSLVGDVYNFYPDDKEQLVFLSRLYVVPEYRHHGVATFMVNAAQEEAHKLQIDRLMMFTVEDHIKQLCGTHGWKVNEIRENTKGIDQNGDPYDFGISTIMYLPIKELQLSKGPGF